MPQKYFIFRNATVESFFSELSAEFSGYGDISYIPAGVDAYFWFYLSPIHSNAELFVQEVEAYSQQFDLVLSQIAQQKAVYAFTIHPMHFIFTENSNTTVRTAIENYNNHLSELFRQYSNLKVIDFSEFCSHYASSSLIDRRFYYISQMQINPKLINDFSIWLQRKLSAIEGKRKKCLVLDLDNTLWGGILGEDGMTGIQIGNTYPGNAFLDFQNNLLELSKSGIILTVCSKNNEPDVIEAWEKNPFLQIKGDQLAAWRINWNNKADNIVELAEELNIGLDSMVFVDDNPTERALVKQMLPTIETPDFPKQPYLLPEFFEKICQDYFQIYNLTKEDKDKLQQYKTNTERASFQKSFASFDDYIQSLEIVLDIQEVNSMNLPRIAQMTQKTNQFNLTTKRNTDEDIKFLVEQQGAKVYCISVKDKFGDNGITGAAIVTTDKNTKTANIDSFLLSCRILGKNIENIFLKYILLQMKNLGYTLIHSIFIPTLKNGQVSDFYEKNGFRLIATNEDGTKIYTSTIADLDLNIPNTYKIIS